MDYMSTPDRNELPEYWRSYESIPCEEAREILRKLDLVGRKIKAVYAFGIGYANNQWDLEDSAYRYYERMHFSDEECMRLSKFSDIPPETPMWCYERLDEPFRILFEDGDVLNIEVGYPCFKADLNGIPFPCQKHYPVDLNVVLRGCLGKEIARVKCRECNDEDTGPWENQLSASFVFTDGSKMVLKPWLDYFEAVLYQSDSSEEQTIPFGELKNGILFEVTEEE